ncbi:hypothetical protein [Marinactinospora rubrisoli]|uniref:Uncharacterized protein n=1 Tax=Marinactinospora rubrisoli TaxID=2715399 RepID=A0ABW2KI41_9ACTN
MTHYPEPPMGSGDPHHQTGGDPFASGHPSGGHPSGGLVPYNQTPQTGGWQAPPGYQTTPPGGDPTLTTIGDITVTQTQIITPGGTFPLRGSTWTINNLVQSEQKMPTWALLLALLGFLFICVFSLFFLLVKETRVSGTVQVAVRSGQHYHVTQIPVHSQAQVNQVHQNFNYIRSVAAGA